MRPAWIRPPAENKVGTTFAHARFTRWQDTKGARTMELLARAERLIEALENNLQDVDQELAEHEALQSRGKMLAAELQSVLDSEEAVSAESPAAAREWATALDACVAATANQIQALATLARELRSGLPVLRASVDRLRGGAAAEDVAGPLPEAEAALERVSDGMARNRDQMAKGRQLNEEVRRQFDRGFELIAETKARLAVTRLRSPW